MYQEIHTKTKIETNKEIAHLQDLRFKEHLREGMHY